MPEAFKSEYPNIRLIIDATEFSVERPSSVLSQASTFSAYKNKNTAPSGAISFVPQTYEGSISDRKLVELSGLLNKLKAGDEQGVSDPRFVDPHWCMFRYSSILGFQVTNAY